MRPGTLILGLLLAALGVALVLATQMLVLHPCGCPPAMAGLPSCDSTCADPIGWFLLGIGLTLVGAILVGAGVLRKSRDQTLAEVLARQG